MAGEVTEAQVDAVVASTFGRGPRSGVGYGDTVGIAVAEVFGRLSEADAARERAKLGQPLSESATLLTTGRTSLLEATAVKPAPVAGRRIRVTLITPGSGSSGYYPASTLEAAARDRTFPKGLHLFVDHQGATEERDRSRVGRSVRDLAGVLTEDARWTGSALVADAELTEAHAGLLAPLAGVIGMSIRATGEVEPGEVDGQRVLTVTRLTSAESCDFVTRAGRGGFFELLESGRSRWGS